MVAVITIPPYKPLRNVDATSVLANQTEYAVTSWQSNTLMLHLVSEYILVGEETIFHELSAQQYCVQVPDAFPHISASVSCDYMHFVGAVASDSISIRLSSRTSDVALLEFASLQEQIVTQTGESCLIFYRLFNSGAYGVTCISVYYVYPETAAAYLNKVQCLCYDMVRVNIGETIEPPVLFYMERGVLADDSLIGKTLHISYVIFAQR